VLFHAGVIVAVGALVKAIDKMNQPTQTQPAAPIPLLAMTPGKTKRYCSYCKSEFISEKGEANCPYCGAPTQAGVKPARFTYYTQPTPATPAKPASNGLAIASLVLSFIALFICWLPVIGLFLPIIALVLGALGIKNVKTKGAPGKGMAATAIVLSIISIVVSMFITVLVILAEF
jgi:hypothetical protein